MAKLFKISGFFAYILVIFLNAFVDLGHKIIIQNTLFKTYDGQEQVVLTAIVNALILLPFILLFSPAGFLADKYPKNTVIKISSAVAVLITSLITLFYYQGMFWAAFSMTFILAVQSAIYSPSKFGYIRELVGNRSLSAANGMVQAFTMIAILAGTFAFSIMFENLLKDVNYNDKSELLQAIAPVGWFLILSSVIELTLAFQLPEKQQLDEEKHFDFHKYKQGTYLKDNFKIVYQHRVIWLSIIGLSIFWAISQVLLASFPAFAKETMGTLNTVLIQGMMACAGIGIMLGSIISGRFSKNHIETGLLPFGAIGIALCLMVMPGLTTSATHAINFLVLGVMGGMFVVPLNALIQFHAKEHELGIVLAANNLVQTAVMFGFLLLTIVFAWLGLSTVGLIGLLMFVAVLGAAYTLYHLPQSFTRIITGRLIASKYKLHVQGFENFPENGGVLMLGNHISFIDWAILQMAIPRQLRFVMARSYYERWYLKSFLDLFGVIPIAPRKSKEALASITELLNKGEVVVLFPEGMISRNGQLSEFKQGYEKAAENANGVILPFHLRGLWGSRFSRSSDKLKHDSRTTSRRDIIVAFGKPLPMTTLADELKQHICALSIKSWETYSHRQETIPAAWLETAKQLSNEMALTNAGEKALSNSQLVVQMLNISGKINKKISSKNQNIGLYFPNSTDAVVANLACLMSGKTIVNLSLKNILVATNKADIKTIITTKKYFASLTLEMSEQLANVEIILIEDLYKNISLLTKLTAQIFHKVLPTSLVKLIYCKAHDIEQAAAIIFSSMNLSDDNDINNNNANYLASKGVILSHRNLMTNIKQVAHVLNTEESDVMLACLPLSNAFGLTITTLLPLIEGIPVICVPTATNVLKISKAVTKYNATILISTPSILKLFNTTKKVHPLMLESLRIVVSGTEKLSDDVKNNFKLKFQKDIFEGYGTTETSPVASVNVPDKLDTNDWKVQMGNKQGSVGMPVPGTSFRIVKKDTEEELSIGETGQILIGGPQVMLGYVDDADLTERSLIERDDIVWFRTNENGYLDKDGYLTLTTSA